MKWLGLCTMEQNQLRNKITRFILRIILIKININTEEKSTNNIVEYTWTKINKIC